MCRGPTLRCNSPLVLLIRNCSSRRGRPLSVAGHGWVNGRTQKRVGEAHQPALAYVVLSTVVFVDRSFSGSRVATPFAGGVRSSMCKSETYVLDASFNPEEFVEDIKKAKAAVGEATEEDAQHLQHLVMISQVLLYEGHILLLAGAAMPWGHQYPFVVRCGLHDRLCQVHEVGPSLDTTCPHGGFDSLQKNHPNALPKHYKRGVFAIGFRRFLDWWL